MSDKMRLVSLRSKRRAKFHHVPSISRRMIKRRTPCFAPPIAPPPPEAEGRCFYKRLSTIDIDYEDAMQFNSPGAKQRQGTIIATPRSNRANRVTAPRPPRVSLPPLKPLKNLTNFDPRERLFLEAAERGDKATIEGCLEGPNPVNVNCTELLGRTPIEIAVDNENVEIVAILLQQPGIKIGNALLYAIREGVYNIVEMMINHETMTPEMLGDSWGKFLDKSDAENFEYSSDISPIILAAHLNQFEILQLLLSRGATIRKPHPLACPCPECEEERMSDSLHHSLQRIHTYRALTSPAWISLTSSDPVLTAFKLSWELQKLSVKECEFKDVWIELSDQLKDYACDLLSQCRTTEEVIAVLNKDNYSDDPEDIWGSKLSLARLKLAIKYEQKQFVAHPHCQQLLTSIWYEGFPGRQERGSWLNILVCIFLILAWPVLSIAYILCPRTKIGQIVRSPFMKFLYYSTSFSCFLLLLTLATFESHRQHRIPIKSPEDYLDDRANQRGPKPNTIEWFIFIWVLGMIWTEVKQLWDEGYKKYIRQWWNWLDFIMMSLYLCTFSLRGVGIYLYSNQANCDPIEEPCPTSRSLWPSDEPLLVSESLFAVANIFSFARIIYLFQTNPYLGPLQISLGCMLIDIGKFFFIFFLVLSSFAIGLHQLYWYYGPSTTTALVNATGIATTTNPTAFISIANSYATLVWSLFSITDVRYTEVNENHEFTELIGRGMYIAYHVTSIIVLLNMLIAMMSHSFQIINDHADMEWKFHRSKLWMSYFDEGSSLSAPFNIIVTPKSVMYSVHFFRNLFKWLCGRQHVWHHSSKRATIRRPGYSQGRWPSRGRKDTKQEALEDSREKGSTLSFESASGDILTYQEIMRRLVSRYIHLTKKEMKMDGVSEDDLLEIKQDISSLRYELREDRRREILRSSSHIDGVKKEIIRSLSQVGPKDGREPRSAGPTLSQDECFFPLTPHDTDSSVIPRSPSSLSVSTTTRRQHFFDTSDADTPPVISKSTLTPKPSISSAPAPTHEPVSHAPSVSPRQVRFGAATAPAFAAAKMAAGRTGGVPWPAPANKSSVSSLPSSILVNRSGSSAGSTRRVRRSCSPPPSTAETDGSEAGKSRIGHASFRLPVSPLAQPVAQESCSISDRVSAQSMNDLKKEIVDAVTSEIRQLLQSQSHQQLILNDVSTISSSTGPLKPSAMHVNSSAIDYADKDIDLLEKHGSGTADSDQANLHKRLQ